jgi:hypothetical protein
MTPPRMPIPTPSSATRSLAARAAGLLAGLALTAAVTGSSPVFAGDTPEPTVEQLLDATDDTSRGTSSHGFMTMEVKTDRYERTMKMEVWTQGTEDSLIRILVPAKDKGVSTLKVGENMWNYIPKIDKTLKIASTALSGSWMGSHITNDDLVKGSRMREDYSYVLSSKPADNADQLYVIDLTPNEDAPVVWGKVSVRVRADQQPKDIRYYDEDGALIRTLSFEDIKEMSGRTFATTMRVVPAETPEEFTVIRYEEMEFDVKLPARTFSIQSLKR